MKSFYLFMLLLAYPTAVSGQNYNVRGSAEAIGTDCYRLTQEKIGQSGVVWYTDKINLTQHFDIEFRMNFGTNDFYGADGMVFIMQTVGNTAIGANGVGLGFGGFYPSLGVEFDTFQNPEVGDPYYDHIAVISNGSVNHNTPTALTQPVQTLLTDPNIEDGKDHQVRITWEPSTKSLTVYVDCQLRIQLTKDLVKDIFKGQTSVWWGFSGATGLSVNNQTVCLAKQILFSDSYTVCPGGSTILTGRLAKNNIYRWSPTAGLDNPSIRMPRVSPKKTTTYVVTYMNYCEQTVHDTIQVIVPVAIASLGKDTTLCQGAILILNPGVPDATYQWQDGSSSPSYKADKSGLYSVEIIANGCSSKSAIQIRYVDKTAINLGRDTLLCTGATLLLQSSLAGNQYKWQDGSQKQNFVVSTAGIYSVSVTLNGCTGTDSIQVAYAKPLINLLGPDTTLCQGQSLTIHPVPLLNQIIWQDGSTSSTYRIKQPGLYWAKVQIHGCTTMDSILVKPKPVFRFRIGNDTTLCSEKSLLINLPMTTDSTIQFSWMDGSKGPSFTADSEGYVWLESNLMGCIFRDSLRIKITPCSDVTLFVPDAFTPNSDGTNDTFRPTVSGRSLLSYSLIIYSRWGNVVYATTDQQDSWDGTYKTEACTGGQYAYKISITYPNHSGVEQYDKLGAVFLIR